MTDTPLLPEQNLEKSQPKIEGATEANIKLAKAGDVSPTVKPPEPAQENEKLKLATGEMEQSKSVEHRALQAHDATPYSDKTFADSQGRLIVERTWPSGDLKMVRAYDQNQQTPPEIPNIGQAGSANLTLEHSPHDGSVTRARLNDLETSPTYRGSGIGGHMLNSCEELAQKNKASEIYGAFQPHGENPTAVRDFYQKHGYQFRPGAMGGEEVFKRLN